MAGTRGASHEHPEAHPRRAGPGSGEAVTVDVVSDVVIDRPIAAIASYAANPSNAATWYANIDSVHWQGEQQVAVGARVAFVARFLGRRLDYTYEIVEHTPGARLVMRTAEGPFPMETTYTWTAISATSTRMELRNRGEPAGFSKVVAPFMARAMRRANRKDLALLKRTLEAR